MIYFEYKLLNKNDRGKIKMAVNRLAADMLKIADILNYNCNNLDIGNIGIETFTDTNSGDKSTMPLEVVYDKEKDMDYGKIEFQISKIYNAFMYGEQSEFWRDIILNKFEASTQVDFMLLVSFIYMRHADIDNKEVRIAETMSIVGAILAKYNNLS